MPRYCVISAQHDYRSARRASIHFVAAELAKRGTTRFFSCRFSSLSRFRPSDPRSDLAVASNRVEMHDGVECFLWRPVLHPISLPRFLSPVEAWAFRRYLRAVPEPLVRWLSDSDVVVIESGISIIFLELVRKLNPAARVVYSMSDDLAAIGAAGHVRDYLKAHYRELDLIRVPSRAALASFPGGRAAFIPQGIDTAAFDRPTLSPFAPGSVNGVSVGSMLFDDRFFTVAGAAFPDVQFHVIGSGTVGTRTVRGNITYYPEMPFEETIPYLQHADFGIAPYRASGISPFLGDTSMKLTQFSYLGLPAVCPVEVAGQHPLRFGYRLDDPETVRTAIDRARTASHVRAQALSSWSDVVEEMLRLVDADPGPAGGTGSVGQGATG